MSVIFLVVPLAIVLAAAAVWAFIWAARRGQFDDLDSPAWRVLDGEEGPGRGRTGARDGGSEGLRD